MLISAICGFSPQNLFNRNFRSTNKSLPATDTFACNNVVFLGSGTGAGTPLKRLVDAPDPFFGALMIRPEHMERILKELESCTTVKKSVKYLRKYKPYMNKTELAMFERFENAAPTSPRMQFQELLQQWYDAAIVRLKLEEFAVLDDIDKTSQYLTPETELKIRAKTTKCRTLILENEPGNAFKRKTLLNSLEKVKVKNGEEEVFADITDKADYLPSSATSENAFIVKYSNRSHEEITKRLIRPSELTIDHLHARALGGENKLKNFVPASQKANNLKGHSVLEKFVKRFPEIAYNFQVFMDYMINLIKNGGFKGHQLYPYQIQKKAYMESGGKIKLNLSNYNISRKEAARLEKEYKNRDRRAVKAYGVE